MSHQIDEPLDATLLIRQRAGFVELRVETRREHGLRQFAQEEFEKAGDDVRVVIRQINGFAAIVSVFQLLHLGFHAGDPVFGGRKRGRSEGGVGGKE